MGYKDRLARDQIPRIEWLEHQLKAVNERRCLLEDTLSQLHEANEARKGQAERLKQRMAVLEKERNEYRKALVEVADEKDALAREVCFLAPRAKEASKLEERNQALDELVIELHERADFHRIRAEEYRRALAEECELPDSEDVHGPPVIEFDLEETVSTRRQLVRCLDQLEDQLREVLILRFGLDGKGLRTLKEVGAFYGRSSTRAMQLIEKALRQLRHPSMMRRYRDEVEHELYNLGKIYETP